MAACPAGDDPADVAARNDCAGCAGKLTKLGVLRDAMREPFTWGGQAAGASYRLDTSTNKFNARRVWRRMYRSTVTFGSNYTIEQPSGTDTTVLHMPITSRGAVSAGACPYPV